MTATHAHFHSFAAATIMLLLFRHVNAGGYHYNPPAPASTSLHSIINTNSGHYFNHIPTIAPLPPVPALPALPTGPPRTRTQTLVQVHPASQGAQRSQGTPTAPPRQHPSNYNSGIYNAFGNYLHPEVQNTSGGSGRQPSPQPFFNNPPTPIQPQLIGYHYSTNTASVPTAPAVPTPQPLRMPFGKQPTFSYGGDPDNAFYVVNGRQLKQYAVVEEVDNDISQDIKPFLTQNFFNNYRAQVGASGTGALAPLPSSMQFSSTANAVLLEQQRLALQDAAGRRGDTIALGSGGIGYVRLPDGTVSLGSGSLNFVTGQQHLNDLRNARTRSELQRDALHFGHGPLEDRNNNQFLFK